MNQKKEVRRKQFKSERNELLLKVQLKKTTTIEKILEKIILKLLSSNDHKNNCNVMTNDKRNV